MAFNPFHTFRKHQKVIFAILTIICMIVFILQFGSGDVFQRLLGHGSQGKGEKVVTLYGEDIYQSDLTRLAQTRTLVNQLYVNGPVIEAVKSVMDDLAKDQEVQDKARAEKKDPTAADSDDSKAVRFALLQWKEWNDPQNPQRPPREEMSRMIDEDLQQIARERDTTKSDEIRRKLDAVSAALRFQYWAMNPRAGETQRFFFGGSTKTEDLLDFKIWKHQADHVLSINLTRDDLRKEMAWDAAGRDVLPKGPWKDDAAFKPYVVQEGRIAAGPTEDDILDAIADEYRVCIAQTLLMGYASGVRSVQTGQPATPDPTAPYDFYSYYRKNRAALKVAFLSLPVESFMDKVDKREPSEEDLQRLFDRYKDQLPEPTRASPAFKEPRRIQIQYVTAKPDSPYYKDAAARNDAEHLVALQLLAAGTAQSGAGGAASWANLAYGPHTLDGEFLEAYGNYLGQNASVGDLWVDPLTNGPPELHDPAARHLEAAAADVGRALGGVVTPFGCLGASVGTVADSALYEANDRIARGAVAGLAGAAIGNPYGAAALAAPSLPASPPPAVVADKVLKKLRDQRAPQLALQNLSAFLDELTKLKNKPDEARQYVAKAVKDFGFDFHTMEQPKGLYDLAADPNLKPLKDAYNAPDAFNFQNPQPKPDFIDALIATTSMYDPKRLSAGGVVQDDRSQNDQRAFLPWYLSPENRYVFWHSVDDRAHELSYGRARAEVVQAWRQQEARKLALAEANRIEAEARVQPSPQEAVKYLRDQKDGEVFELAGVARLVAPTVANVGVTHPYMRYAFPENRVTYPPRDLLDRLMELNEPGKTLIFKDQPQKEFFVAVLEERVVPGVKDKDFLDAFADATQPQRSQLWHEFFLPEWERDYQKKLLRQLRAEAGAINDQTGKLVLNVKPEQHNTAPGVPEPNPTEDNGGGDSGL